MAETRERQRQRPGHLGEAAGLGEGVRFWRHHQDVQRCALGIDPLGTTALCARRGRLRAPRQLPGFFGVEDFFDRGFFDAGVQVFRMSECCRDPVVFSAASIERRRCFTARAKPKVYHAQFPPSCAGAAVLFPRRGSPRAAIPPVIPRRL